MCGSGRRTGMQHTVLEHRLILRVQLRAPPCLRGGSWTIPARTCVRPTAQQHPQHPLHYIGFRVGFQQQSADVASPEMSILGDANITQLQGVAWVDPGVEAHDVRDGNLTSSVSVSGYGGCKRHWYLYFDLHRFGCCGQ